MQNYFEGFSVGSEDDEVSDSTIETFGGLVGSLFDLLGELGLVEEGIDLLGDLVVGFGPGARSLFGLGVVLFSIHIGDYIYFSNY